MADSILASARRLSGTCSTRAMPERYSCSIVVSSMQLRVTTSGNDDIVAGDLVSRSLFAVVDIFVCYLE